MRDLSLCMAAIPLRSADWGWDFIIVLLWPFRRERNRSLSHRRLGQSRAGDGASLSERVALAISLRNRRFVSLKPGKARLSTFSTMNDVIVTIALTTGRVQLVAEPDHDECVHKFGWKRGD
jgi:hypothetical protein